MAVASVFASARSAPMLAVVSKARTTSAFAGNASRCTDSAAVAEPPAATLTEVVEALNASVAAPDAAPSRTIATAASNADAYRVTANGLFRLLLPIDLTPIR